MGPNLTRRIFLRFAFSTNPGVATRALKKLEAALTTLAAGGADEGQTYYAALDAYRDVMYFLGRFLDPSDFQDIRARMDNLTLLTKHPLQSEDAIRAGGPDLFKKCLMEAKDLAETLDEALVMESYARGRS